MAKGWYVVHTYSGYELKAKEALESRIKQEKMEEYFEEILVPTETVVAVVKGQRKTSQRKIYPGYIIVHMELNDETWHLVKDTPKIMGFANDKITDSRWAGLTITPCGSRLGAARGQYHGVLQGVQREDPE